MSELVNGCPIFTKFSTDVENHKAYNVCTLQFEMLRSKLKVKTAIAKILK